jgi:heme/copper-type cytochrome/quinol oxidase subunit 3
MFKRNLFTAKKHIGIKLAGMYWFLVVGLWPVLYALVYLK